jgi:hypothetical protein
VASPPPAFPDGHFYSPVVDIAEARRDESRIWTPSRGLAGIDLRERHQRRLLAREFRRYLRDYRYPDEKPESGGDNCFFNHNTEFGWLDSRALFVLLRTLRPRRMIEVGSGFSSLLTADVNQRFLRGRMHFTCIEPYPRPFLRTGVPGISELIEARVQDVPTTRFDTLRGGDVLFIDSSHVSKTGSDVNYLVFDILPRLRAGVVIHFHDIFFPDEYKKEWVLAEGRSWNEQYLVRALLMFSGHFEVIFGSYFAYRVLADDVKRALGGSCYGGGSLWIRKTRR